MAVAGLVVETEKNKKPIDMNLQEGEFRVMVNKANWPKSRVTGLNSIVLT